MVTLNPSFQSSPTPKGGRYVPPGDGRPTSTCFNPRPPRKVGATAHDTSADQEPDVSILAHPERWALHDGVSVGWGSRKVSILAHPERWALRASTRCSSGCSVFQSSPTPKGGRYVCEKVCPRGLDRFNPRPPRKVGATVGPGRKPLPALVSILAHPERWALLCSP